MDVLARGGALMAVTWRELAEASATAAREDVEHRYSEELVKSDFPSPIEESMFFAMATRTIESMARCELFRPKRTVLIKPDRSPVICREDGTLFEGDSRFELDSEFCLESGGPCVGYPYPSGLGLRRFFPQCRLGRFFADFVVEDGVVSGTELTAQRVVVECDGHDYHERTKEQAKRDRARDRFMQTFGIGVLRFTGSEIHRDALACADQVFEYFASLRKRGG